MSETRWRERWEALAAAVAEHVGPWETVGVDVAAGRLRDAAYRRGAEDMRERAAAECEAAHASYERERLRTDAQGGSRTSRMLAEERQIVAAQLEDELRALPVEPEGERG